jgi:hypothetical protein
MGQRRLCRWWRPRTECRRWWSKGGDVTISRLGVPAERVQRVQAAVEKLLQLRDGLVLEGDLRAIARDGLD